MSSTAINVGEHQPGVFDAGDPAKYDLWIEPRDGAGLAGGLRILLAVLISLLLGRASAQTSCNGAVCYPPSHTVVSPAPVKGAATFAAACSDPYGCRQLDFGVDGITIATVKAAPFTTFDTTLVVEAVHSVKATATPIADGSAATSLSVTGTPRTFYIATNGNDSSVGTAAAPWRTPAHNLRCGDTVLVQPGNYANNLFASGKWGQVGTCPTSDGYYFANLRCNGNYMQDCLVGTLSAAGQITPDKDNWLVQGFTGCTGSYATARYVAFVNIYARNCPSGLGAQDYAAFVGVLAYGGGGGVSWCVSGLSVFKPTNNNAADTGTHIFVAGSFFINNTNPPSCTDGEGIIFDSWYSNSYTGRGVIEQSLFIGNCSEAFEVFGNSNASTKSSAPVFFVHNTTWGNGLTCGGAGGGSEVSGQPVGSWAYACCLIYDSNISVGTAISVPILGSGTVPFYTISLGWAGSTTISNSYVWNSAAPNQNINARTPPAPTITNVTFADPGFAAPAKVTAAPDCSTSKTTFDCMAAIRASFKPSGGAAALGYQPPGVCAPDLLYPVWLKGAVPDGLITKPCGM